MKVLNKEQLKNWDQATIKDQEIKSTTLMFRASNAFVQHFCRYYDQSKPIIIFVGTGNNGGDGLVIGDLLKRLRYDVKIVLCNPEDKAYSEDNDYFQKLNQSSTTFIKYGEWDKKIPAQSIAIDAIFGYGFEGELRAAWQPIVDFINANFKTIVAVDIPSGLSLSLNANPNAIKAHRTFTFEVPKLPFLLPEYQDYVGKWEVIKIGLTALSSNHFSEAYSFIDSDAINDIYLKRSKFSHKGHFGHALLIAGSLGKVGACILSAKSSLRAGLGLLSIYAPKVAYNILQTSVPEAMIENDLNQNYLGQLPDCKNYNAIAIGPGIGQKDKTKSLLIELLNNCNQPLVLDADAINILSELNNDEFTIPKDSILTPHPKEFDRLLGKHDSTWSRIESAIKFCKKHNCIFVLKGAHTAIIDNMGNVHFNSTGNPGLSTAGSGDVLTGIILALLGQSYSSQAAAILGVYLHGLAADLALQDESTESLIATDIITHLGKAFKDINQNYEKAHCI